MALGTIGILLSSFEKFFERRDSKLNSLLDGLPDPAPKALVDKAFKEVRKLYTTLAPDVEARVLHSNETSLLRIDLDPDTKQVYKILSDSCSGE